MKYVNTAAITLVIIGGLNWLLVGAMNVDLVATIFGTMTAASRFVYVLVGLAAIYLIFIMPRLLQRLPLHRSTVVN